MRKVKLKVILYPIFVWILYFSVIHLSDLYIFLSSPSLGNEKGSLQLYTSTRPRHPDVYFFEKEPDKKWIVKKVKGNSWIEKLISHFMLAHEFSVLRSIQDLPYVSKLVGKIDEESFSIEYITPEENVEISLERLLSLKEELSTILGRLHERYIYHRDLAHLCNVVLASDHHSYIIDFGNAVQLDPIIGSLIGPIYAYKERIRLLRMCFKIDPKSLTDDEFEELLRYKSITRCFFFSDRLLQKLREYEQLKMRSPSSL